MHVVLTVSGMRTLREWLLGLFGISVIVAVVVFVSVLYGCTAVVADMLVRGSRYVFGLCILAGTFATRAHTLTQHACREAMLSQVSNIGNRTGSEMSDVFKATMDMAATSFLYPVVYGLFDAFDENRPYPVASPDLFMGNTLCERGVRRSEEGRRAGS